MFDLSRRSLEEVTRKMLLPRLYVQLWQPVPMLAWHFDHQVSDA